MSDVGELEAAVVRFYEEPNNSELHQLLTE